MVTRSRCAAATSYRKRDGTGTPTTMRHRHRWRGSTALTYRSNGPMRHNSSNPAVTHSPVQNGGHRLNLARNGRGAILAWFLSTPKVADRARRYWRTDGNTLMAL